MFRHLCVQQVRREWPTDVHTTADRPQPAMFVPQNSDAIADLSGDGSGDLEYVCRASRSEYEVIATG